LGRARIALTVVVLVLLAMVLAVTIAPWSPARAEAAAELFSSAAADRSALSGVAAPLIPQRETGPGAHLAGTPVSSALDRAAASG
jgi:hypothetical protein